MGFAPHCNMRRVFLGGSAPPPGSPQCGFGVRGCPAGSPHPFWGHRAHPMPHFPACGCEGGVPSPPSPAHILPEGFLGRKLHISPSRAAPFILGDASFPPPQPRGPIRGCGVGFLCCHHPASLCCRSAFPFIVLLSRGPSPCSPLNHFFFFSFFLLSFHFWLPEAPTPPAPTA